MTQTEIDAAIAAIYGSGVLAQGQTDANTPLAQANLVTSLNEEATLLNQNLNDNYLSAFNGWAGLVKAGKIDESNPPKPPSGVQVMQASNGWSFIMPSGPPVATMPALPVVPIIPSGLVVAIGQHLSGEFWAALPTNNVPAGTAMPITAISIDGTSGSWTWVADPFGGWWEKTG